MCVCVFECVVYVAGRRNEGTLGRVQNCKQILHQTFSKKHSSLCIYYNGIDSSSSSFSDTTRTNHRSSSMQCVRTKGTHTLTRLLHTSYLNIWARSYLIPSILWALTPCSYPYPFLQLPHSAHTFHSACAPRVDRRKKTLDFD